MSECHERLVLSHLKDITEPLLKWTSPLGLFSVSASFEGHILRSVRLQQSAGGCSNLKRLPNVASFSLDLIDGSDVSFEVCPPIHYANVNISKVIFLPLFEMGK